MFFYEEVEQMTEEERNEMLIKLINHYVYTKETTAFNINVETETLNYQIQIKLK